MNEINNAYQLASSRNVASDSVQKKNAKSRIRKWWISAMLVLLSSGHIQIVQALEIRVKSGLEYRGFGGTAFSYPSAQGVVDGLKTYYESIEAQSDATSGYHQKIIGIVSCAGTAFESGMSETVNGEQSTYCIQSQEIIAGGAPKSQPVVAMVTGPSATCPVPDTVWGYPQHVFAGNDVSFFCNRYTSDLQPDSCTTCNPVAITSGLKLQKDSDYGSSSGLSFTRNYRGDTGEVYSNTKGFVQDLNTLPDTCYQGMYASNYDYYGKPLEFTPYCFAYTNPPLSSAMRRNDGLPGCSFTSA